MKHVVHNTFLVPTFLLLVTLLFQICKVQSRMRNLDKISKSMGSGWKPHCSNWTQNELRRNLLAEVKTLLDGVSADLLGPGFIMQDFEAAFEDPIYINNGFLMGTEIKSPFRMFNQLLFTQLKSQIHSRQALQYVNSKLQLTLNDAEINYMSHCDRAKKSVERAKFLVNNDRLMLRPEPQQPPNVIFIIADDLGWADVGVHDPNVFSPFIDRFHTEGIALNNYYVDLVCSPSRASFMTGRFPITTGALDWFQRSDTIGLALSEVTLGNMFREASYVTRYVGKWHLGYYSPESTPTFRGFDSFYGMYGGGGDYYRHVASKNYDQRRDFTRECGPGCSVVDYASDGMYSTNLFGEEAVRLIMHHNISRPLFMIISFQAVHGPAHDAPFSYSDSCQTLKHKRMHPILVGSPLGITNWTNSSLIKDTKRLKRDKARRKRFTGVITAMDSAIENITASLALRGMLNNTLIVFTTDNGAATSGADSWGSSNYPFRGGKHTIWEGGTRGVGAVWGHPMTSNIHFEPYVSEHMMHGVDWFPTLRKMLDMWHLPKSQQVKNLHLDGVSQFELFQNSSQMSRRTGFVYGNVRDNCKNIGLRESFEGGCGFGIREGPWKLIYKYGGFNDAWPKDTISKIKTPNYENTGRCPDSYCLFNVVEDPYEAQEASFGTSFVSSKIARLLKTVLARKMQLLWEKVIDVSSTKQRRSNCVHPTAEAIPWFRHTVLINEIHWKGLDELAPIDWDTKNMHFGRKTDQRIPFVRRKNKDRSYWTYGCAPQLNAAKVLSFVPQDVNTIHDNTHLCL